ncbi:hypothetical protein KDA23_07675 [Candidatus Saccharibacteria bacterium]|nr:hypothetical protein [Candidatus Saccharibacteria bacterium]
MQYRFQMMFLLCATSPCVFAETSNTCGDVYAGAVQDVSFDARQYAENNFLFTAHCESNGEIREGQSDQSLSIVAKKVNIGFSGNSSEARSTVSEFCKEFLSKKDFRRASFRYELTVVGAALRSFNDCKALEHNGMFVRHYVQQPRSVIVRLDFNPDKTNVIFRGAAFDNSIATCSSTALSSAGTPVVIDRSTPETSIDRPFSIICERTPEETSSGAKKFQRFVLGVDTNHGTYNVEMPTEEMFGYDLASANQARHMELQDQKNALEARLNGIIEMLNAEVTTLKNRIDTASAEIHLVKQGEKGVPFFEHVACPQHGGDFNAYVSNLCGSRRKIIQPIQTEVPGGWCGYNFYAVACMNQ